MCVCFSLSVSVHVHVTRRVATKAESIKKAQRAPGHTHRHTYKHTCAHTHTHSHQIPPTTSETKALCFPLSPRKQTWPTHTFTPLLSLHLCSTSVNGCPNLCCCCCLTIFKKFGDKMKMHLLWDFVVLNSSQSQSSHWRLALPNLPPRHENDCESVKLAAIFWLVAVHLLQLSGV